MLYFNRTAIPSICAALDRYNSSEFESPTRSTVALLSLVLHGGFIWGQVLQACVENQPNLHLEYQVPPPRGKGKPSHTDIMLEKDGSSCALEAKWTEPRYEEVRSWLNGGKSAPNRQAVLAGWISLMQCHASEELIPSSFDGAPYQMVHRAASACTFAHPAMAYLQFVLADAPLSSYIDDLRKDLKAFRAIAHNMPSFSILLFEVGLKAASFSQIAGLPKNSPSTALVVKQALRESKLFEFPDVKVHRF